MRGEDRIGRTRRRSPQRQAPTFIEPMAALLVQELPEGDEWSYELKPQVVAQIRFVEWTAENRLRHAKFLGLRLDKNATAVRRET
jgi:ATP-dependent DNA ligase